MELIYSVQKVLEDSSLLAVTRLNTPGEWKEYQYRCKKHRYFMIG